MRLIEEEGYFRRGVADKLGISKTTVNSIAKRHGNTPNERRGVSAPRARATPRSGRPCR